METKKKNYPPRVDMTSCVGICEKTRPVAFGNYCSIDGGPYLVNMWAENLEEWALRNPDVKKIEVTEFIDEKSGRALGVVTDTRLEGWTNKRPCITGRGWINQKIKNAICSLMDLKDDPAALRIDNPEGVEIQSETILLAENKEDRLQKISEAASRLLKRYCELNNIPVSRILIQMYQ